MLIKCKHTNFWLKNNRHVVFDANCIYFMKELKKEYGLSYDQLVSWLILT